MEQPDPFVELDRVVAALKTNADRRSDLLDRRDTEIRKLVEQGRRGPEVYRRAEISREQYTNVIAGRRSRPKPPKP